MPKGTFSENFVETSEEMVEWVSKAITRIFSEGTLWGVSEGVLGGPPETIDRDNFQMNLKTSLKEKKSLNIIIKESILLKRCLENFVEAFQKEFLKKSM